MGGVIDADTFRAVDFRPEAKSPEKLRLHKGNQLLSESDGEARSISHVRFTSPSSLDPCVNIPIVLERSCRTKPSVDVSNVSVKICLQSGSEDVGTS